jgi:hypothetical protein
VTFGGKPGMLFAASPGGRFSITKGNAMLAIRLGLSLLGLVIAATISVTPVMAQKPCYLPDGTMYIGVQPPADCSTTRPKSRDEAIQRDAKVPRPRSAEAAERAALNDALIQQEVNRRLMKDRRTRIDGNEAEEAIGACDFYKHRPSAMNAEQSAICNRYWGDKASRTLAR